MKGVGELMHMSLDSPTITSAVKLFKDKLESLKINLDLCDRVPSVLILDKVV